MCFFCENIIYFSALIQKTIVAKTFIYSMYLVTFVFFFLNRLRFVFSFVLNFCSSVIMFADELYYRYSSSLLSVAQISNLQYSEQISEALKELVKFNQIFYFVDLVCILILLVTKFININKGKSKNWKPAILYSTIMVIIFSSTLFNNCGFRAFRNDITLST